MNSVNLSIDTEENTTLRVENKERRVKKETRVHAWDNLKFVLILCVVIGHTIDGLQDITGNAYSLYLFIYTFHMPAFLFISGVFSKRVVQKKQYDKVVMYVFIYLLMKFLDSFMAALPDHKMSLHLFWEAGPGWYAWAMAVYLLLEFIIDRYFLDIDRKKLIIFAIFIGVICSFDNHLGDHFAASRIANFYVFFVAGTLVDEKYPVCQNNGLNSVIKRLVGVVILLIVALGCLKMTKYHNLLFKLLKGKYPLQQMESFQTPKGIILQLVYYAVTFLLIWALIHIVSNRESVFSMIGCRSLAIFIWHKTILTFLMKFVPGKAFFQILWPAHPLPGYILLAIFIALICASEPLYQLTKILMDLTKPGKMKEVLLTKNL